MLAKRAIYGTLDSKGLNVIQLLYAIFYIVSVHTYIDVFKKDFFKLNSYIWLSTSKKYFEW